jgi:hypothetical protein
MTLTIEQIENTYNAPAEGLADSYYPVLADWIPSEKLEEVRAAYRASDTTIRIRYRGPRTVAIGREMTRTDKTTYLRSRHRAMQDCLIADATHFTVYDYTAR